jgi:DNA (cytosine-5)-methyltransferase 1
MKPRLLDLFSGAGGAAVGYARAGFEVVGVDIEPQPNYPFEFVRSDALDVLRLGLVAGPAPMDFVGPVEQFDAIHASPPCQAHTALSALEQVKAKNHPDLVGPTRELLEATGLPYVIENVVGAPLRNPTMLCGSAFGLDVRRHRLFETNFPLMSPGCAHGQQEARFDIYEHGKWRKSPTVAVYGHGGGKSRENWHDAMDIDWMTHRELAQAIPPAYTEHVGGFLLTHLAQQAAA